MFRFARIPDINRDSKMNDNRQIKILQADQSENLVAGGPLNVFSSSPDTCRGTERTSTDGLKFYDFS